MHVHVESDGRGELSLDDELMAASARYFKASNDRAPPVAQLAALYRERQFARRGVHRGRHHRDRPARALQRGVAEAAAEHADVLIPFGSVDPHAGRGRRRRGPPAGRRPRRARASSSTRACRRSRPTTAAYPLYEAIEEPGVPALFHTGQTGIGAGLPGGGGSG